MVFCINFLRRLRSRRVQENKKEYQEKCGISIHHLKTEFLTAVKHYTEQTHEVGKGKAFEDITIYDICEGVIKAKGKNVTCPRDNKVGAAYVDCLVGNDHVGPANVMLSYGWLNKVKDIVSVLDKYCVQTNQDPKRTYAWICCLCNNQFRIQGNNNVTFEELQHVFQDKVIGIGNIVALMSPWNDPIYLKRVWCIFEFYTASSSDNVNLKVFMPPEEEAKMIGAVVLANMDDAKGTGGMNDLYDALNKTNIEEAGATVQQDKENILQMVKEDCGVTALNVSVNQKLRQWVSDIVKEFEDNELQKYKEGSTDLDLAKKLHNIAAVYDDQGNYDEALKLYNLSCTIHEKVLGEEDSSTATIYNNIATVYRNQGKYDEALKWYDKCRVIEERTLGGDHPDTATTYHNIATVYYSQGKIKEASELYDKCRTIRERTLGLEHPSTATTYNNLGLVCDRQGNYEEALEWYRKCCQVREKTFGVDHPSTAMIYHNIASVYDSQGKYDEAFELYKKCLMNDEKTLGEDHPSTASTYGNLAGVCRKQGRHEEALTWYNKCRQVREKALGEDHPLTATTYLNMASVYESQGKYDDAFTFYDKSRSSYEKTLGKEHSSTANLYHNLACLYEKQGRYDEALEWYEKCLAIREKTLGKDHLDTIMISGKVTDVLYKTMMM